MVEPAVADVVGPAVAADDPDPLLHEVVGEEAQPRRVRIGPAREQELQVRDPRPLRGDAGLARLVRGQEPVDEIPGESRHHAREELARRVAVAVESQPHPHAELRVVLEERVRPGRAASLAVGGVGRGREVAAVDRAASGGVGHQDPVAEELRQELDVRRLAASGAGAGILEERLEELRGLHIQGARLRPVGLGQVEEERVVLALGLAQRRLRMHVDGLVLGIGLVFGRTEHHAEGAAGAILGRDLDRVLRAGIVGRPEVDRLEGGGRLLQESRLIDLDADRRVRADERALVALDADRRVPHRDLGGDVAFLPLARRRRARCRPPERR